MKLKLASRGIVESMSRRLTRVSAYWCMNVMRSLRACFRVHLCVSCCMCVCAFINISVYLCVCACVCTALSSMAGSDRAPLAHRGTGRADQAHRHVGPHLLPLQRGVCVKCVRASVCMYVCMYVCVYICVHARVCMLHMCTCGADRAHRHVGPHPLPPPHALHVEVEVEVQRPLHNRWPSWHWSRSTPSPTRWSTPSSVW